MRWVFPTFSIDSAEPEGLLGSLSATRYGDQTWIGEGHLGFVLVEGRAASGIWRSRGDRWLFVPDKPAPPLLPGATYEVLDGYWGLRAEIVLDRSRRWRLAEFQPSDAVECEAAAGSRRIRRRSPEDDAALPVIPGGWDHEHCEICSDKVGRGGSAQGYFSAPDEWLCVRCFREYVESGSLGFIPRA